MGVIVDVIIFLVLGMGAILGFKKGVIKSATEFFGVILVFFLAFNLKNVISPFMYTYLPFFKFSGSVEGLTVLNILIYEAIAFLVVFGILYGLLKLIIVFTGFIEFVLKATIILAIPSKLLGLAFGLLTAFLISFIGLFIVNQLLPGNEFMNSSYVSKEILNNTPILSSIVGGAYESVNEIIDKAVEANDISDKEQYNKEAFILMLDKEILSIESALEIVKRGKIDIELELLDEYR